MEALTQREEEILILVIAGYTNKEIADKLCISAHTVKVHISSLLKKYEVSNRVILAVKAVLMSENALRNNLIERFTQNCK